jgi:hypothetical protein
MGNYMCHFKLLVPQAQIQRPALRKRTAPLRIIFLRKWLWEPIKITILYNVSQCIKILDNG